MIRDTKCILVWAAMAACILGAARAQAASDRLAMRFGYIDLDKVLEGALPVKEIISAATKKFNDLETQAELKTKELLDLSNEQRNSSILSDSRKEQLKQEIEKVDEDLDRLEFEIQREFKRVEKDSITKAMDMIIAAIDAVAQRDGFALIVKSDAVVYGHPSADITQKVIDHLNQTAKPAAP